MCASWNGKHDVSVLVKKLEAAKKSSRGVTTFEDVMFGDAVAVLHSSLKSAEGVPQLEQTRILYGAIFTVGAAGEITASKLLAEIRKREASYLRSPEQNFIVATSMSIKHFDELRNAQVQGCRITFGRRLPRRFHEEQERAIRGQFRLLAKEIMQTGFDLNAHTAVRVAVRRKTSNEAALAATNVLTLLRGIWNYHLNLRRGQTFPPPIPRKPVNEILLGPAHTVHESSGTLKEDTVWFETSFQRPVKPYRMEDDWPTIKDFELKIRELLKRAYYREDLEEAFRRYAIALDVADWNASFLQLWSLLEYLTDSGAHYDTTIKRILFVCPNSERVLHREILKHLRTYRNATVHSAEQIDDLLTFVYQTKRYVEWLLWFHLGMSSRFQSLGEAGSYLHLPPDPDVLRQRRRLLKKALDYQVRDVP